MKKYIVSFLFLLAPSLILASSNAQVTNHNKFSYNKPKASHSKSIKQIGGAVVHNFHVPHLDQTYLIQNILIKVEGINFQGSLEFMYKDYLNKYVSNTDIMNLCAEITKYFIKQDYLLPQVIINEKDLASGAMNITVRIESIEDVIFVGEANNLLQNYAKKILDEKPTRVKRTQRYLALMNKVPGVKVQYKLREDLQDEANKQNAKINLLLFTSTLKGQVFTNIDNYGVNDLGKAQAVGDIEFFSPLNIGDSLSFGGLTTNHPNRLYDLNVKYGVPINDFGSRAYFIASHAEDNPTRTSSVTAENSKQNSFHFMTTHPLYLTASKSLELKIGADYKTLANYGVINDSFAQKTDSSKYLSGRVGLEYAFKDNLQGVNIIHADFARGINGDFNNFEDPNNIADERFNTTQLNIYREQPLINNFSIYTHVSANYSNKSLPDQELFILGGRTFGRGYSFCTLDGSKLTSIAVETRYTHHMDDAVLQQLQPYIFMDSGHIDKQSSDTNISTLSSAGTGLRLFLHNNVELGVEIAQPLKTSYIIDGQKEAAGTRINLFLNKIFKF